MEEYEHRITPAVLPAVTVTPDTTQALTGGFGPQSALNPAQPNKIVLVSTDGGAVNASYSVDGGLSFTGFFTSTPLVDPLASVNVLVPYTNVSQPSLAFGRDGSVYIVSLQHNATKTSGVVILHKFNFSGDAPVQTNLDPTGRFPAFGVNQGNVLYLWAGQDPARNPAVGVDNNIPNFTDPTNPGTVYQDTMVDATTGAAKAVYVAWNTDATPITPLIVAQVFNPNAILATGSSDGGLTFSTPVHVTNNGYVGVIGAASPKIVFSQGNGGTSPGGQLTFVWNGANGGGIVSDTTSPDNGNLTQDAVNAAEFLGSGDFIDDAFTIPNTNTEIPVETDFTIPVTIDPSTFGTITDLNVSISLRLPSASSLGQLSLDLISPNGQTVRLLFNRQLPNPVGGVRLPPPGGIALGMGAGTEFGFLNGFDMTDGVATIFDDEAPRSINDPDNLAPYIGHYRTDASFASSPNQINSLLAGLSLADLTAGVWTLRITDYKVGPVPPPPLNIFPQLLGWGLKFSGQIDNNGFGADTGVAAGAAGGPDATNPGGTTIVPNVGIGPGVSVAYDTSLGTDSPFSGRLYAAFTTAGNDIALAASDDNGASWSVVNTKVNDDEVEDNFTEGVRPQFMPSVAVDPLTGTVVVMWYDLRNDAGVGRAATYMATSLDGGATFSPQTYLNRPKQAVDAYTRDTVTLEPIPTNLTLADPTPAGDPLVRGIGTQQSVLAYGGRIIPFWTGNDNAGGTSVYTAVVRTAAGPRVVTSDMGPIVADAVFDLGSGRTFTHNNTFAVNGTRQLDGFVVQFDRSIDPTSFAPDDIQVFFRTPSSSTGPGTSLAVQSITNLIPRATFPNGTSLYAADSVYFVRFTNPQTAVGTYSYTVGPQIRDSIRNPLGVTLNQPAAPFDRPFTYAGPPIDLPDSTITTSTITVPALPPGQFVGQVIVDLNLQHTHDSDLTISLRAPNGTTVVLVDGRGSDGDNFTGTRFIDSAAFSIADVQAVPPFTGEFRPEPTSAANPINSLALFAGLPANGTWTLIIDDNVARDIGQLLNWSLTIRPARVNTITDPGPGNWMDQDADSLTLEYPAIFPAGNDLHAVPKPVNGVPFQLPYTTDSLPLVIPGPRVVGVAAAGPAAQLTGITVDTTRASTLFLTFETPIDPATFQSRHVVQVTGPTGDLIGPFGVTAIDAFGNAVATPTQFFRLSVPGINLDPFLPVGNYTVRLTTPANGGPNGTVSSIVLDFTQSAALVFTMDKAVLPGNFTSADIQQLFGPAGVVAGPFTVTGIDAAGLTVPDTTPTTTFRVVRTNGGGAFPVGAYSAILRPDILAGSGVFLNTGANALDIRFDRDMNPATFTTADIVKLLTPVNTINNAPPTAPFTVTQLTARTFRITFPDTYTVSGQYSLELGSDIRSTTGIGLDNNLNAGVSVLRGGDPLAGTFIDNIYASTAAPVIITPGGTVAMPISISDDLLIQSDANHRVTIRANITFPAVSDLQADLVHLDPSGIEVGRVRLFTQVGTLGPAPRANFINTLFDDRAAVPIQFGTAPFDVGPYNPQLPLSAFVGQGTRGTWRLEVRNNGTLTGAIQNFTLTLPVTTPGTGLAEPIGDRFQGGVRVFIMDPTNPVSQNQWTPVGPAPGSGVSRVDGSVNYASNAGRVASTAIDPSDPSGNTVFLAAASGGIWKTTNFLTTAPQGPTWIPLTDSGPTFSLNLQSLAVVGRNGDSNQTIVFALTGEGNFSTPGVGLLRSMDGGRTWSVLDSTSNADAFGNVLPVGSAARDHLFYQGIGYKVIIDPTPLPNGQYVVYMAMSGDPGAPGVPGQAGLWRSVDTGLTWTLLRAGQATDVALAAGSATNNGTLGILYAAFRGEGVYFTPQAPNATTGSLSLLAGLQGNNLIRNIVPVPDVAVGVAAPANSPTGANGRITLAVPALTNDPLLDSFYQGWVYAYVSTPGQRTDGLFLSKDFGRNWTDIIIPQLNNPPFFPVTFDLPNGFGTNDETRTRLDTLHEFIDLGDRALSLAVDPTNPNIVYLGGGFVARVDVTKINSPQTFVFGDNSRAGQGALPQGATAGGAAGGSGLFLPFSNTDVYETLVRGTPTTTDFLNLQRDPFNPFVSNATLRTNGTAVFTNTGENVSWKFGDEITGFSSFGYATMILPSVDPVTGKTRLVVAGNRGVFSGIDTGDGSRFNGVGLSPESGPNRNGNLQIAQLFAGAAQPSQLAADIAGALFYGMTFENGFPVSTADVLQTGDIEWRSKPFTPGGTGTGVATDPGGSGTAYQYRVPFSFDGGEGFLPTDFFRTFLPGSDPENTGISRTNGLVQAGDDPGAGIGQWPPTAFNADFTSVGYFNTNPIDPEGLIIGSDAGRVFRSTDQGRNWFVVAEPADLDGTYARATAFGSPDPSVLGQLNNFLYAGTVGGEIFVTLTGGGAGAWVQTQGLDGSPVMQIVPNSQRGKKDAFAVTQTGVFYLPDATVPMPTWQDVTGSLLSLREPIFNDPNTSGAAVPGTLPIALHRLNALAVDWRYTIPIDPSDPTGPSFPIVYVGGNSGVFRTLNILGTGGPSWTSFPNTTEGATVEGGYLPSVEVSDLDLSLGDINPTTGLPEPDGGLGILLASTYGRGQFAIRLNANLPIQIFNISSSTGPRVVLVGNPNPAGPSNRLQVTFSSPVDPFGFTPSDVTLVQLPTTPGGLPIPVRVTGVTLVSQTAPDGSNPRNVYDITFDPQTVPGPYQLTIGTGVSDLAGNFLNQNRNQINGEATDSFTTTVFLNTPAVADTLQITGLQTPVSAGDPTVTFTVTARRADGTIDTSFNGMVQFATSDTAATVPGPLPLVNGTGTFTITFRTAGPQSITVTGAGATPTVNPATEFTVVRTQATQLLVTNVTSPVVAGGSTTFTVTAMDAFGNLATEYTGTVSVSSTDPLTGAPFTYTFLPSDFGVHTFTVTLQTAGTQTITVTDTLDANRTGSGQALVIPAAPTALAIGGFPSPTGSGVAGTVTVTGRDAFGNLSTTYTGTVRFTSTDPSATLPADAPLVNGIGTFTVILRSFGIRSITVTDTVIPSLTATQSGITVTLPPPALNTPPTISDIADRSALVGTAVGPIGFTIGDLESPPATLSVTGTSSNPAVVANTGITFGGAGANRTITLTPSSKASGSALITVTVTDGSGSKTSDTFTVTYGTPNTAPRISDIPDQTTPSGKSVGPLVFSIGDSETAPSALVVTAVSSNPALVPLSGLVFGGAAGGRTITVNPVIGLSGTSVITVTVTDASGFSSTDAFNLTVTAPPLPPPPPIAPPPPPPPGGGTTVPPAVTPLAPTPQNLPRVFSVGAGLGANGSVTVHNGGPSVQTTLTPFEAGFTGGVRVATGRNPGGVVVVMAPGPGHAPEVRVTNLGTGTNVTLIPFELAFTGGLYVSTGDLDRDGYDDYVMSPDEGGGPRVQIVSGRTGTVINDFFGIDDPEFRGGARTAVGDVNGDGVPDLVVAAGFGGGPRVSVYDGRTISNRVPTRLGNDFFAFESTLRNGVYLAVGDIDGDGRAEIIAGAGPGGGPRVTAFSGASFIAGQVLPLANFFLGDTENRGGIRVGVTNLDNDGSADLVVGSGEGGGSRVTGYLGTDLKDGRIVPFFGFDELVGFTGGVFVG